MVNFSEKIILIHCLIVVVTLLQQVNNTTVVEVTLLSYSNPDNKLRDGTPCVSNNDPCTVKIAFAITEPVSYSFVTAEQKATRIDYGIGPTAIKTWDNKFISNPFNETTDIAITKLKFTIKVYDYTNDKEEVASFGYLNFAKKGFENHTLSSGFSEFKLTVDIRCAADYYNTDCTVHCVETDHFSCNDADGSKICKSGWIGPNCDIEDALPCSPTPVVNGSYSPDQTQFTEGEHVTITCQTGFIPASTTLSCLKTGKWDSVWPLCYPIKCRKLALSSNLQVAPLTVTNTTSPIGASASFSCLPGSTLQGEMTLECGTDGTWNSTEPVCNINLCPDIQSTFPTTALYLGYYSPNPPKQHPGSVFNQECIGGSVRRGPKERVCQNNGTWTGQVISCHKLCSKFFGFSNGRVLYSAENPYEGCDAEFICNQGYTLSGSPLALCLTNGTWNITRIPQCIPTCHAPAVPSNVTVSPSTYVTDTLSNGYTLTFSCLSEDPAYLTAPSHMTCSEGAWNSSVPACLPIVPDIQKKRNSLLRSALYVAGGVAGTYSVILLVLVTIHRKIRSSEKHRPATDNTVEYANDSSIKLKQINVTPIISNHGNGHKGNNQASRRENTKRDTTVVGIRNMAFVDDF